jgi:hypothetical protein
MATRNARDCGLFAQGGRFEVSEAGVRFVDVKQMRKSSAQNCRSKPVLAMPAIPNGVVFLARDEELAINCPSLALESPSHLDQARESWHISGCSITLVKCRNGDGDSIPKGSEFEHCPGLYLWSAIRTGARRNPGVARGKRKQQVRNLFAPQPAMMTEDWKEAKELLDEALLLPDEPLIISLQGVFYALIDPICSRRARTLNFKEPYRRSLDARNRSGMREVGGPEAEAMTSSRQTPYGRSDL